MLNTRISFRAASATLAAVALSLSLLACGDGADSPAVSGGYALTDVGGASGTTMGKLLETELAGIGPFGAPVVLLNGSASLTPEQVEGLKSAYDAGGVIVASEPGSAFGATYAAITGDTLARADSLMAFAFGQAKSFTIMRKNAEGFVVDTSEVRLPVMNGEIAGIDTIPAGTEWEDSDGNPITLTAPLYDTSWVMVSLDTVAIDTAWNIPDYGANAGSLAEWVDGLLENGIRAATNQEAISRTQTFAETFDLYGAKYKITAEFAPFLAGDKYVVFMFASMDYDNTGVSINRTWVPSQYSKSYNYTCAQTPSSFNSGWGLIHAACYVTEMQFSTSVRGKYVQDRIGTKEDGLSVQGNVGTASYEVFLPGTVYGTTGQGKDLIVSKSLSFEIPKLLTLNGTRATAGNARIGVESKPASRKINTTIDSQSPARNTGRFWHAAYFVIDSAELEDLALKINIGASAYFEEMMHVGKVIKKKDITAYFSHHASNYSIVTLQKPKKPE